MKFKRFLTFVAIILLSVCVVGCGNNNTTTAVANNLQKNADRLSTVVSKLEEFDNRDIVVKDISPLQAEADIASYSQSMALYSKYGSNLGYSTSKTSARPNDKNAKYVNATGQKISANTPYQSTYMGTKTDNNLVPSNYAGETYAGNSNFKTAQKAYKTRYVNDITQNFTRDSVDSYLSKVENCYNSCADCIGCNAEYKIEKTRLEQNLRDCKVVCQRLRDGTITLSQQEIEQCQKCLNSLNSNIQRLKSTKGNVSAKQKNVEKLKSNFASNLVTLDDAYQKLSDALQCRIECVKDCNNDLNCLFDIINKTNVNISDAQKNKSDQKDIELSKEKLQNEINQSQNSNNSYPMQDNNLTNLGNAGNAQNSTKNIDDKTVKNPAITNQTDNLQNESNAKINANKHQDINTQNTTNPQNQNGMQTRLSEQNKNIKNNTTNLNNNPANNLDYNNQNANLAQNRQNATNQNPKAQNYAQSTQNRQIVDSNGNQNVNSGTQNNNAYGQNNYDGTNQNYGYNGPYQNGYPYPPKNIDTYRNITKNIDTYGPYYAGYNRTNEQNNAGYNGQYSNDYQQQNQTNNTTNNTKITTYPAVDDKNNVALNNDATKTNLKRQNVTVDPIFVKNDNTNTTTKNGKNMQDLTKNGTNASGKKHNLYNANKLTKKQSKSALSKDQKDLHSSENSQVNTDKNSAMQKNKTQKQDVQFTKTYYNEVY